VFEQVLLVLRQADLRATTNPADLFRSASRPSVPSLSTASPPPASRLSLYRRERSLSASGQQADSRPLRLSSVSPGKPGFPHVSPPKCPYAPEATAAIPKDLDGRDSTGLPGEEKQSRGWERKVGLPTGREQPG
jgi:hypothetical protein